MSPNKGNGRYCAVFACHNNQGQLRRWRDDVCEEHSPQLHKDCPCLEPFQFRYFPSNDKRKMAWVAALKRKDFTPTSDSVVCSLHFVDGRPTERNPVPQINLGYDRKIATGRRILERKNEPLNPAKRKKVTAKAAPLQEQEFSNFEASNLQASDNCECFCHSCTCCANKSLLKKCGEDKSTQTEIAALHDHESYTKSVRSLENPAKNSVGIQVNTSFEFASNLGNKDCIFYTGLQLPAFLMLVQVVTPLRNGSFKMSIANQILLVLMRLRLGLTITDVGKRFGMSKSTASFLFKTWIRLLAKNIGPLIMWLPKEVIRSCLSKDFEALYPKTTCIVDCTEFFTERPISLKARAYTWSTYKSHNTLKVLLCIAPNGYIMFVSPAYGGRASNKFICSNSGFYDYLLSGDEVMADRGFTISDELTARRVSLNVPPFLRGRNQMSEEETTDTRRCASVRVHIERAIARLKNYRLLKTVISPCVRKDFDSIVIVCAALWNLKPKLIKKN